jgi:hypothetical protein
MSKKRRSAKKATSARKRQSRRAAVSQSARGALSVATNARKTVKERVAAMSNAPLAVCEDDQGLQAMLDVLRNPDENIKVRLAALASLQAASFSVTVFASCRSDYISTLREVMDDPDLELRQRVLGILSREKDGLAQKRLLAGLENPAKALVAPEKALQLLGYDPHVDAYKAARKIVEKPPNEIARREALRLLAADTASKSLFEKILGDKSEATEYRQISAAALHAMAPDTFQKYARDIVVDASESDEIQATSLTALSQFGDAQRVAADRELITRVGRMKAASSPKVKQTAKQFLAKYGVE